MKRGLDLFCHAGGSSIGYDAAGYHMTGMDIKRQDNYPFDFIQGNAMEALKDHDFINSFDLVHLSPPCQLFTVLSNNKDMHVDLLTPTLTLLQDIKVPWILENVPNAKEFMPRDSITLCGSMFNLGVNGMQLRRHRLFASNFFIYAPGPCRHQGPVIGVYGNGTGVSNSGAYQGSLPERSAAMELYYMTSGETSQAIPSAYTYWLSQFLVED